MNLESLDLAIGLFVVFLLISTTCSAVREAIEAVLKTRAAYLERGIRELLNDKDGTGLAKSLFEHPLLSGLFLGDYKPRPLEKKWWLLANGRGLPSYIPARSVALALLDIAARGSETDEVSSDPSCAPLTIQSIRARLLNVSNVRVRRVLLHALDTSHGNLDLAKRTLEDWFNDSMDRVSGWYKRSTQWVVFVIAISLSVGMNVDSIGITKYLYRDHAARDAAVALADAIIKQGSAPAVEDALKQLSLLKFPIGWDEARVPSGVEWVNRVFGWLVTAFAATLGAPFWFDVLNKVMVIRSTVKPREKSQDEFSEDRQAPGPGGAPTPVGAAAAPAVAALAPVAVVASDPVLLPRDPSSEHDCCGHSLVEETTDEELPSASGGVAP